MNCSFPPSCRIRKTHDYQVLFRTGRRIALPHFIIYYALHEQAPSRLGITVSRKVGNAVVRNRCKRYMRETFRRLRPSLAVPVDLSVQFRPGAAHLTYLELYAEIQAALLQAGMIAVL